MKKKIKYIYTDKIHNRLAILLETIDNILLKCKEHGFNRQSFYNIKAQNNEIYLRTFLKLAEMLEISPAKLLEICLLENKTNLELKNLYLGNLTKFKYEFDYQKLKNIYSAERAKLKEDGSTLVDILNEKSKEGLILEQRQIENVLAGKNCSLKAYLYTCELLGMNPIETMKNCIKEKK
ncbi:hypothetical protein [Fusobacterium sp.]|uniref:hypothetical protein n=1 Tax=Fusobacterium sp. TaxID=68766 RepID=UPI0025B96FD8|nr:hypothetical protein [Fusobacterium sp.]